jgi:hypothetical protein
MDQADLVPRLELEISKYLDITTIFKRLIQQQFIPAIYSIYHRIFTNEHNYTIKVIQLAFTIVRNLANFPRTSNHSTSPSNTK